jgi:putative ABC transport system ATP-binding protein
VTDSTSIIEFSEWKPDVGPWRDRLPQVLRVHQRDIILVDGPSGSGKTLFLRSLVGLEPAQGTRWLFGEKTEDIRRFRKLVQYVPQFPVFESRVNCGTAIGAIGAKLQSQAAILLSQVGFADPHATLEAPVENASVGERLRLGLVRAILLRPRVLVLDEWSAGLDPIAAAKVRSLLLRYVNSDEIPDSSDQTKLSRAIIMTNHDVSSGLGLATCRFQVCPVIN